MRTSIVRSAAAATLLIAASMGAAALAAVPELTQADADAWLDGFMPFTLESNDIAGAVVVIVKDGQVLTQRGFGYADIAARKRVDPATTMFRAGSISKLFTWTAVMQLVEQGKIDLDADVNRYLDFKIPPYQGKADHDAQPHDAYAWLRRSDQGRHSLQRGSAAAERGIEKPAARTGLCAWHDAGLLELWRGRRQLYRRARFRNAVCRLRRAQYIRAPWTCRIRRSGSRCRRNSHLSCRRAIRRPRSNPNPTN